MKFWPTRTPTSQPAKDRVEQSVNRFAPRTTAATGGKAWSWQKSQKSKIMDKTKLKSTTDSQTWAWTMASMSFDHDFIRLYLRRPVLPSCFSLTVAVTALYFSSWHSWRRHTYILVSCERHSETPWAINQMSSLLKSQGEQKEMRRHATNNVISFDF